MPIADTYSGLQQAADTNDAAYRSGLESALNRLMQVAQFRDGKKKEDALKERQFQFMQQQHADQLKQQVLSNARNAQLDDDNYFRWNATLDSNEGIKDAAALDRAATQQQAEDDRRMKMAIGLLGSGQITNPKQLARFSLSPNDQEAAAGVLSGLASEGATREAQGLNAAAVANFPAFEMDRARSSAIIKAGHDAQKLKDENQDVIFDFGSLSPTPGTAPITPAMRASIVTPRIDPREVTIDAATGLAVPIYHSPYTIPLNQGTIIGRQTTASVVDRGSQLMAEAQAAIAAGADPVKVRLRIQQLMSQ